MPIQLHINSPEFPKPLEFSQYATMVVGRGSETQIRLANDPYFSRYHFRLELSPPECKIVDLDSRNGTFVNGRRVDSAFLQDGDNITAGKLAIGVRIVPDSQMLTKTYHDALSRIDEYVNASTDSQSASHLGDRDSDLADPSDSKASVRPQIGKYEILREIGHGTMGLVYCCRHLTTHRKVALKVIVPSRAVTEKNVQMFLREANLLAHLQHRRIVRSLEFGLDAGVLYLAMEYVSHRSFNAWSKRMASAKKIRFVCCIASQVLAALEYAHAEGVVHRDIKPENILLGRRQGRLDVRVADFGLAKNFTESGLSGITHGNELRGTIGFMSPEQLIDSKMARPPSDIYSVGAMMYFFLCGEYPFDFPEKKDPIAVVLGHRRIPMNRRKSDLPGELVAIVHRALEEDPEHRFSSASEMHRRLKPFLRKHP